MLLLAYKVSPEPTRTRSGSGAESRAWALYTCNQACASCRVPAITNGS